MNYTVIIYTNYLDGRLLSVLLLSLNSPFAVLCSYFCCCWCCYCCVCVSIFSFIPRNIRYWCWLSSSSYRYSTLHTFLFASFVPRAQLFIIVIIFIQAKRQYHLTSTLTPHILAIQRKSLDLGPNVCYAYTVAQSLFSSGSLSLTLSHSLHLSIHLARAVYSCVFLNSIGPVFHSMIFASRCRLRLV